MQALFGMLAGGGEVDKTVYPVQKTDAEWKKQLGSRDFNILRQGGTERGGTGEYNDFYPDSGYFACKGCGFPLYSATSKFEDLGGSPSTSATTQETSATLEAERSMVKWKCTATIAEGTWGMSFMGREARHLNVTESTRSVSSM
eukprot:CAMPEP_0197847378 /NCGR_PEP_ID=MMETSP1438-20131217/5843_1 /TAXON_ID=1461541 /ORGANISM="Pterosperma sp., Strain CCMP1384" /LENGTH=143 /DNA_ID=CAMNT_0043459273 /DNA_START=127 /DNA_END=559 /DNA_ORIENTATION=-